MDAKTKIINAAGERVTYEYGDKYSRTPRGRDLRRAIDPTKKRGWQVNEMWESHHEIARRILLGGKNVDIAKAMGISEVQVSNVRNSHVVKEKLAVMAAARDADTIDLAKEILELAPIAIKRVKEALTTGKVKDQVLSGSSILKEANGILDRQIGKPTQTINTRNLHGYITNEDMDRIKARAAELAGASGQLGVE